MLETKTNKALAKKILESFLHSRIAHSRQLKSEEPNTHFKSYLHSAGATKVALDHLLLAECFSKEHPESIDYCTANQRQDQVAALLGVAVQVLAEDPD